MKRSTRKNCVKNADINTNKEELKGVRQTVIRFGARRQTTMGTGNSQVCELTDELSQEGNILKCPVGSSALKPASIKGGTGELLHCTPYLTTQLCGSCLYPCTSAACTNKLCPLVSTLLTCEVVSDPKSKVLGCPMFRACPKCHSLIMHERGCKFVICASCSYNFCFICLQDDCGKNDGKYWSLTCSKPRAERQRFLSPQS